MTSSLSRRAFGEQISHAALESFGEVGQFKISHAPQTTLDFPNTRTRNVPSSPLTSRRQRFLRKIFFDPQSPNLRANEIFVMGSH